MLLKSENGVEMIIDKNIIKIRLEIGGNVRLVNEYYNSIRKIENAKYLEWMIKGKEALNDFLNRISLRYENNLGKELREKLRQDKDKIIEDGKKIREDEKEKQVPIISSSLKERDIDITVKWVAGMWRDYFPSINVVMPLKECKKLRKSYELRLTMEEAIKLGYDILYWISASEIAEQKDWTTAESILGILNL